jgi:hypothetical protein
MLDVFNLNASGGFLIKLKPIVHVKESTSQPLLLGFSPFGLRTPEKGDRAILQKTAELL